MGHDESSHFIACRIPFRIDIFFIGMLMCVLLCEHGIACALRWGVALVGVILTRHCSPRCGVQATDPHPGPQV